jgi:lipopolysaccharide export LptBFGC system permease protein LptF
MNPGWEQASCWGQFIPGRRPRRDPKGLADNAELDPLMSIFSKAAGRYRGLRIPLRAFFALFFAVFLLIFLAVVLAALLDRRAVDFFATFPAAFLTAFFARVFLLAFAACLEAARFLRGA